MLTITWDERSGIPLYEQLYRHIRALIEVGETTGGERLPSRRKLAAHLRISLNTVENAYAQLVAEGYAEARPKRGYFVRQMVRMENRAARVAPVEEETVEAGEICRFDLRTNAVDTDAFPFSVWARLLREHLRDDGPSLLHPMPPQGEYGLRRALAAYLREFRDMEVSPRQIVVGAGTEYLLGLATELLEPSVYAVEDPGYYRTPRILRSRNMPVRTVPTDEDGMRADLLRASGAAVACIMPSHHFPLGTIMGVGRRMELLQWAAEKEGRHIVEDDYDSEYRYALLTIPSLQSLDRGGKVIYLNTFAKTLAPSLRLGYMVLPPELAKAFGEKLGFYSCTVPSFEQRTLQSFIEGGYYERHIHRMRTIYRERRDAFIRGLSPLEGKMEISGREAGLHLLLTSRHGLSERELVDRAARSGVRVYPLSDAYLDAPPLENTVIAGYAALSPEALTRCAGLLADAWGTSDRTS